MNIKPKHINYMKTATKQLSVIFLTLISSIIFAQAPEGVSIKNTVAPPDPSAMLDISSSTKGLLIPRVSLTSITDITTIPTPANSLLVYNTNTIVVGGKGYYYYDSSLSTWIKLGAGSGSNLWSLIGTSSHIQYGAGNVRIGNGSILPQFDFEIDKNSTNVFNLKGFPGQLSLSLFDPSGSGPACYLVQRSSPIPDGANNLLSVVYSQVLGDGMKGLELTTYLKPPTNLASWSVITSNINPLYIGSDKQIIFIPNGTNGFNPSAWFSTTGNFVFASDSTKKTNITNMPDNILSRVLQCRPITYNWKTMPNSQKDYGLIAQEVQSIFPEIVSPINNFTATNEQGSSQSTQGINYIALTAILIKAVQQQQAQIQALQTRVTALEAR